MGEFLCSSKGFLPAFLFLKTQASLLIFPPVGDFTYSVSRGVAKGVFAFLGPVCVLHRERLDREGSLLLASNHISHFDPPLLSVIARRKIDWMAMVELFASAWGSRYFGALDAFPTDRSRVDRKAVRTALKRLQLGRAVGIFPDGGIRVGSESVLEGAKMRPGVTTLAQLAKVPVVPCVVLGTDRLYNWKCWLPWRRVRFWVAIGEPLRQRLDLPKADARNQLERELAASFCSLYAEMRQAFKLSPGDLPHSQEEREQSVEC